MPQLQSLVLTDRAATPVDHTFVPLGITNGMAEVVESSGVPIGNNSVKVALNKTPAGRYKAVLKLVFPVVQTQTINGVDTPVVVRTSYINMDFTFEATSTLQERKDAIGMAASALGASKTLVNDTLTKLEGVY